MAAFSCSHADHYQRQDTGLGGSLAWPSIGLLIQCLVYVIVPGGIIGECHECVIKHTAYTKSQQEERERDQNQSAWLARRKSRFLISCLSSWTINVVSFAVYKRYCLMLHKSCPWAYCFIDNRHHRHHILLIEGEVIKTSLITKLICTYCR